MTMIERVEKYMNGFPDAEAIRKACKAARVKGVMCDQANCAISKLLNKKFPGRKWRTTYASVFGRNSRGNFESFPINNRMGSFMSAFDDGRYPEITRDA